MTTYDHDDVAAFGWITLSALPDVRPRTWHERAVGDELWTRCDGFQSECGWCGQVAQGLSAVSVMLDTLNHRIQCCDAPTLQVPA